MSSGAVIYEVSIEVEAGVAAGFDRWLADHVKAMLALPGFVEAHVFNADDDVEGVGTVNVRRVVHYTLENRAALDRYLREDAERMRAEGQRAFGAGMIASRRILSEGSRSGERAQSDGTHCRNCSASLEGQYCSRCGQRARIRMITIWELMRDLFGDIFELDSRLWRSLIPLLFKPGHLTKEYLEGRRVRYMPPFRMYLVLSLLFFLLVSLFRSEDAITFSADEEGPALSAQIGGSEGESKVDPGPDDTEPPLPDRSDEDTVTDAEKNTYGGEFTEGRDWAQSDSESPGDEQEKEACDLDVDEMKTGIGWLDRRLTEEHLEEVCRQVRADKGATAIREFIRNIPTMMFVFLPLIAVLMKFLYPLSKRYYVEHLLFFVHYHAFFFLLLSLLMVTGYLVDTFSLPEILASIATAVVSIYVPVYLFLAMRRVYGQGRLATTFKYFLLGVGYFVCLVLTFTLTVIITALTL